MVRFRALHENIKQDELNKALSRLERGVDPAEVMSQLANQLTNKFLHAPSAGIRDAASNGSDERLAAIRDLYDLDDKLE